MDAKLLEIARRCAKNKPQSYYAEPFHPHEWVMDAMREAAALERQGAKGGEPVAWRWRPKDSNLHWTYDPTLEWMKMQGDAIDKQPLYAHPATPPLAQPETFDMRAHLQRQRDWSCNTFGPGPRSAGVVDHIRKELLEIEAEPLDLKEWIDVTILALDGAWRTGHSPDQIIAALVAKQTKNEGRKWPDWRTAETGKAIEHDRTADAPPPITAEKQ